MQVFNAYFPIHNKDLPQPGYKYIETSSKKITVLPPNGSEYLFPLQYFIPVFQKKIQ
jgi:hypothetical protein